MITEMPKEYELSILDFSPNANKAIIESETIVAPKSAEEEKKKRDEALKMASDAAKAVYTEIKAASPFVLAPIFLAGIGFGYSRGANSGLIATAFFTIGGASLGLAVAYFYNKSSLSIPKL